MEVARFARTPRHPVARILLAALLAGSAFAHAEVTAKGAWVRGTVPAQKSTGAFVTLTSSGDAKLVQASSPVAKNVEIHSSSHHGGVMHMQAVDEVALPAGKAVELRPGGYHVMLLGLEKPLKAGDQVPLSFTIVDAQGRRSRLDVTAEVRPLGGR